MADFLVGLVLAFCSLVLCVKGQDQEILNIGDNSKPVTRTTDLVDIGTSQEVRAGLGNGLMMLLARKLVYFLPFLAIAPILFLLCQYPRQVLRYSPTGQGQGQGWPEPEDYAQREYEHGSSSREHDTDFGSQEPNWT